MYICYSCSIDAQLQERVLSPKDFSPKRASWLGCDLIALMSSDSPTATATEETKTEAPVTVPSPPPAAVEEPAAAAVEEHPNSDIRQLQQLFPETSVDVLEAVLEAGGNLESATELLLSMNDPSYEPEAIPETVRAAPFDSGSERTLMLGSRHSNSLRTMRSTLGA